MFVLTKKKKIVLWIAAGVLALYIVAGFVGAPMVIRHLLENNVSRQLGRNVTVTQVRTNPFTFSARLSGLSVSDATATTLIAVDQLEINLQLISVVKMAAVIKSVVLTAPRVNVVRMAADRFNFSDLIPPPADGSPQTEQEPSKPVRIIVQQLHITDGVVRFEDRTLENPFQTTLAPITLSLTELDTAPGSPAAAFRLVAATESRENITVTASLAPNPSSVTATLACTAVRIPKYAPYYNPFWNAVMESGQIDLQATAVWTPETTSLTDILVAVSNLEINEADGKTTLLKVPGLRIENSSVDMNARHVTIGRVSSNDATAWVRRSAQGQLNLSAALLPDHGGASPVENTAADAAAEQPPWRLELSELALKGYQVTFSDRQPAQGADIVIDQISLDAKDFSTQKESPGTIDMNLQWAGQGTLGVKGTLGLIPVRSDLEISADGMDLRPLQPYLSEVAGLVLTSGRFNTRGKLQIPSLDQGPADIRYSGQVSLVDFKSMDDRSSTDFFNFKSFYLNGVELRTTPFRLVIDEVALTDFYNRIFIAADGTSNLGVIFGSKEDAGKSETAPAAEEAPDKQAGQPQTSDSAAIQVKRVTLQGGNIDFSDLSIKPNVKLPMRAVGGRISGLDTIKEKKADVLLEGKLGGNVPMKITGSINPLVTPPFVDLDLEFSGVDLSRFTPYSSKYLGYEVAKGQVSMNLSYLVADNKLKGQNKVYLNQLTLGNPVASPDATKLPIKLALALLKDRQGNIDIDLPVTGDLEDPEFSIGGIVLKMVVNLIVDIVTSPFKMLGALFGGGQELSYVDFAPGQDTVTPDMSAKLDTLAKILYERPGLSLEIEGQFDPRADVEGLRKDSFDRQLKAARLKQMLAAGQQAVPLEQIVISAEERGAMIADAYAAATFPKPRDDAGKLKVLPPDEMEKLLFTAIAVTDDDLRQLAYQRANNVKNYLLDIGKVEGTRLFVVEPAQQGKDAKDSQGSRVKFNLQ
jgi:outer membrane protein OmpA-like peptidoglycan-associated protein